MQIVINKCNSTLDPSRPCANDTEIDTLVQQSRSGVFSTVLYSINPLINPGKSEDYVDYEITDHGRLSFSLNLGTIGTKFIQDYTIETDESLLPWE